jgi:hypothetical protein
MAPAVFTDMFFGGVDQLSQAAQSAMAIMSMIGKYMTFAGFALIFLLKGVGRKGFFGWLIGGLGGLYSLISYASDLLSYSRILALGLVAGVISQVINLLTGLGAGGPIGFVFMLIVMIAGHALNLAINLLGTFVHAARLQYIEFFGKFYEDGGDPFDPALPAVSMMQGEERALRQLFADPFSLSGVRDYRFGDSVSQINFKASAKTWLGSRRSATPLMVNDRDFCAARRLCVFMDYHLERDCGIDGEEYEKLTELALSYSAHIIRNAVYEGYSVGFYANCKGQDGTMFQRFPLEGGEPHMLDIFRTMASMRAADGGSFPALLDELLESGENSAEVLIFVLCDTPETDARAFELERRGNGVRVYSLPELFFSEEAGNE